MSKIDDSQVWSEIPKQNINQKYEKCLNITEEIYKRINITFQIKKLENSAQSELSDQSDEIHSSELSNETDLFACDKSTSIPSSDPETTEKPPTEKYININNNEEMKKKSVVYKRPKKRFRKRVKKRSGQSRGRQSDGSSDEALPLSRVMEDSAAHNILLLTKDANPKLFEKESPKPSEPTKVELEDANNAETRAKGAALDKDGESARKRDGNTKACSKCDMTFKSDKGLKRHLAISHSVDLQSARAGRELTPA